MTNQNAQLRLVSPQSFSSACVPFSTIRSNLSSALTSWVQSLAAKVQVSSTLTVSHHAFALLAFEPVTSKKQISSAKTALKVTAEMQLSADSNKINNASSFNNKSSSAFKLVVASITNEFSKGQTNDSPAKQCPVPNNDPAIESSLQLHIPMIATSIWYEVFDIYLSCCPTMNVSNTTSVSKKLTMIAPLTLSYYSTPTILLLPCNCDVPANQTEMHTNFTLQLIFASKKMGFVCPSHFLMTLHI
jgi:hypothetical protein